MKDTLIFFRICVLFLLLLLHLCVIAGPNQPHLFLAPIKSKNFFTTQDTIPVPVPPSLCDVAEIRAKLTAAGNVELLGLDNSCSLYFINPVAMTGPDAQAYAKGFGANLVSIQSDAENKALGLALVNQGYGKDVVWIGLSDELVEGTFIWYDGSPVIYTNWNPPDEPNNAGDEDCVQIFADGTWNDLNCKGYNSKSVIEVNLCPVTKVNPAKSIICRGDKVTLTTQTLLGAPNYTYSWVSNPAGFTSNIESPEVSPLETTTYTVTATDRYKCVSTSEVKITVTILNATITPNGPTTFCDGDSVMLTATAAGSYEWDTGQTTQSITVKESGLYTVKIINGVCTGTAQIQVYKLPKPIAAFENTTVCTGYPTLFTADKSKDALVYGWDFGDGTQALGKNPSHTYAKAGTYNVILGVAGVGNCTDTILQKVTVNETPKAGFTSSPTACLRDSIHFNNTTTTDPATTISSYLYSFGDASGSALKNPSHLYAKSGTYTVNLLVVTADQCQATATGTVTVFDQPKADFTVLDVCASDSAKFVDASTIDAPSKINEYAWDFGDGSKSAVKNPSHLYTDGQHSATLIVVTAKGCADTITKELTVFPKVIADFSSPDICLHQPTIFSNKSTGPYIKSDWQFADSTTDNTPSPTHLYKYPKTYAVTLTVTSANNCKSIFTMNVVVHDLPKVKFSAPNVCDGKPVLFTDQSTIKSPSAITALNWDFGDGTPASTLTSPQHQYAAVKQYTVLLKAMSNFGCIDSLSKIITINPLPVPNFTGIDTSGCTPLTTSFQNQSTIGSGKMVKWLWDYGLLNSKSDAQNPPPFIYKNQSHTTAALYTVKLTVTSDSGCTASITKPNFVIVHPAPAANFSISPQETLITNPLVSFSNLSIGNDSCVWNFDGNGTGMSQVCDPPPYSYTDTGTFAVKLIVTNTYGCADTIIRNVIIQPDFVLYIPSAFTPNDDEINDTFGPKGNYILDFEMSIFDRWGNMMYTTKDINLPWNGGIKGTNVMAQSAVYVYVINIKAANKRHYFYKGAVALIR